DEVRGGRPADLRPDHQADAITDALCRREEDGGDPPPAALVVAVAREPLALAVEGDDPALAVEDADERRRRLEDGRDEVALALELVEPGLELGAEPLELGFGGLPVGDVTDDDHDLVLARLDDPALDVAQP